MKTCSGKEGVREEMTYISPVCVFRAGLNSVTKAVLSSHTDFLDRRKKN